MIPTMISKVSKKSPFSCNPFMVLFTDFILK